MILDTKFHKLHTDFHEALIIDFNPSLKFKKMKNKYFYTIIFAMIICLQGYSQCLEDTHTPFAEDSWMSCETAMSPNPIRPESHWIMFDLGFEYVLDSTYLWNLNTWGRRTAGVREAVIDYSLDGVNWISLDTFIIDQAPASYKYQGMSGPSFDNTPARYVLLTALSNWGDEECTGLSEIRFAISESVSVDPDLEVEEDYMVVSPNPVEMEANVSIKSELMPERISLFDLSGRLIEEQNTILSRNVIFKMNALPSGIYFVKAWVGESVLTEKIVKMK